MKESSASAAKRTIANMSSVSGENPEKHCHTGRGSQGSHGQTAGKCHVVGGKVVGTVEGRHYTDEIWKAMSKEQKAKVAELHKVQITEHAVKAASSAPAGTAQMEVMSDCLQTLTHAVQSLDTGQRTVILIPIDMGTTPG